VRRLTPDWLQASRMSASSADLSRGGFAGPANGSASLESF